MRQLIKTILFYALIVFQLFTGISIAQYNEQQQRIFELTLSNPIEGRKEAKLYLNSATDQSSIGLTNNIIGLSYAIVNDVDSALLYFDAAIANVSEANEMFPRIFVNKAILYRNNSDLQKALGQLFLAEEKAKAQKNNKALALIYGEYSSVYSLLARNQDAIEMTLKAISLLEEAGSDELTIAIEKQKLGNLYRKNNDFEFAKRIYDEILPVLESSSKPYSLLLSKINYADIVQHFEGSEASSAFLLKQKELIEKSENRLLEKLYFAKLGKHLRETKSTKAYEYLELSTTLAIEHSSTYSLYVVAEHLRILLEEENYDRFNEIIEKTDEVIEQINFPLEDLIIYYELRATYFSAIGDFIQAYRCLSHFQELSNEKNSQYNAILAFEIKEKYKNELLTKENELLQQKSEIATRNNFIIFIVLVAGLSIALLLVYLSVQKRKSIEKQSSIIRDKLKAETELRQLQTQTIKDQKEELLHLFNANVALNERLAEVKSTLVDKQNQKEALEQFSKIESNEENWEALIRKLRIVEKAFFEQLIQNYPDLTKKEIDFCALVRIGLEYKQIANVLNISHSSVLTKKYRITKKLNLGNNLDFQNWILKIGV